MCWKNDSGDTVGVYNHYDSYPSSLGIHVFEQAAKKGISALIETLKSVSDWREYLSGGICKYCGKKTGQPHSISGLICCSLDPTVPKEAKILKNIETTGYPDPSALYHQHDEKSGNQYDPFKDPLFMEWVYLLKPETNTIEVWGNAEYTEKLVAVCGKAGLTLSSPIALNHDLDILYVHVRLGELSPEAGRDEIVTTEDRLDALIRDFDNSK